MSDIAPGHNLPPFDPAALNAANLLLADQLRAAYDYAFKEQAALVAAAKKWLAEHPTGVRDDDDQGMATEQVAQLKTALDAYHGKPNSIHTTAKEPALHAGRIVDAVLNAELAGPIRKAIQDMVMPMEAYAQAKLRRQQQEAQAAAAVAALITAEQTGDPMAALQAEQEAMDAAAAAAQPVGKQSQVRGDLGGMSSLRGKWVVKITDVNKIPRPYMMPNFAVLEGVMNASKDKNTGRPTAVVEGCEWVLETKLAIRK